MKTKKDELLIAILLPIAVGSVSAYLTGNAMMLYGGMAKPPCSPPGPVFPVVWTVLYILMGVSSYLVYRLDPKDKDVKKAIGLYILQLAFNFLWPVFFFRFSWYLFAFIWLILLWVMILLTIKQFYQLDKRSAYLMVPYLLWVTFAGYLNLAVFFLNK